VNESVTERKRRSNLKKSHWIRSKKTNDLKKNKSESEISSFSIS